VRLTVLSVAIGLVLWELLARFAGSPQALVPDLAQILRAFGAVLTVGYPEGTLVYTHLAVSLGRIFTGVLAGVDAAVAFGLVVGWFPAVYALAHLVITVARGMSVVALILLAIVWLRIDEASKVALIVYASFWIMLTHVVDAVRQVDARRFFRPDVVIVGMMFVGAVGGILSTGLSRLGRRLARWAEPEAAR
jgi:ABC-type nitrate/sulfonate/bicarbonate transport system permease component